MQLWLDPVIIVAHGTSCCPMRESPHSDKRPTYGQTQYGKTHSQCIEARHEVGAQAEEGQRGTGPQRLLNLQLHHFWRDFNLLWSKQPSFELSNTTSTLYIIYYKLTHALALTMKMNHPITQHEEWLCVELVGVRHVCPLSLFRANSNLFRGPI